jgi:hypothetical protein
MVVIWQMTMTSLLTIASPNVSTMRGVLIFVVSVFFVTRFVSVMQGIGEVLSVLERLSVVCQTTKTFTQTFCGIVSLLYIA